MEGYKHSVSLDIEKCKGCTACLKRCPTEAIRIRGGHAIIKSTRCIDCGECIKVCSHHAKKALYDSMEDMDRFKFKVALPAPVLYGQFSNLSSADYVVDGLYKLGFDYVYEVAAAAEMVSAYTREYLARPGIQKPVISSACPAIMRMIQMNFPFLVDNLLPILPPVEVAAQIARSNVLAEHPELKSEDVGVCLISPCPAKVSYVKNGFAGDKNNIDCVLAVSDIYFALLDVMDRADSPDTFSEAGMVGIGWASTGGESSSIMNERYLAADGIENCIRVLEQIDNDDFIDLDFIELNACSGGCVGGSMNVADPYIAQARLQMLRRYLPVSPNGQNRGAAPDAYLVDDSVSHEEGEVLSTDRAKALQMMNEIESICKNLPGIDCGSCGAPTCLAFAEDIVKGQSNIDMCTIIMRELFSECLDMRRKKQLSDKITSSGEYAPEHTNDNEN